MDDDWTQNGAGMAVMVARLPKVLTSMLGPNTIKPRVLLTDRGPGFYVGSLGVIVEKYRDALSASHFRPFAGYDGKAQPPDLADVLIHETVAAWIRKYFKAHPVKMSGSMDANFRALTDSLKQCQSFINKKHDVDGLCRSFSDRIKKVIAAKGDRLKY